MKILKRVVNILLVLFILYEYHKSITPVYYILDRKNVCIQKHSNDCGVAVIVMILNFYDIDCKYKDVYSKLILSREGVSIKQIQDFLIEKKLIKVQVLKVNIEYLKTSKLPVIAHVNSSHFVVIDKISNKNSLLIRDPAKGRIIIEENEFIKIWKGTILSASKR